MTCDEKNITCNIKGTTYLKSLNLRFKAAKKVPIPKAASRVDKIPAGKKSMAFQATGCLYQIHKIIKMNRAIMKSNNATRIEEQGMISRGKYIFLMMLAFWIMLSAA